MPERVARAAAVAVIVLAAGPAVAAERTVTFAVDNMTCASCPYIVRTALVRVAGVRRVEVSFETRTATVTFDDAEVTPDALTAATAGVGFPSRPVQ